MKDRGFGEKKFRIWKSIGEENNNSDLLCKNLNYLARKREELQISSYVNDSC